VAVLPVEVGVEQVHEAFGVVLGQLDDDAGQAAGEERVKFSV
jgi:hypothetical protein